MRLRYRRTPCRTPGRIVEGPDIRRRTRRASGSPLLTGSACTRRRMTPPGSGPGKRSGRWTRITGLAGHVREPAAPSAARGSHGRLVPFHRHAAVPESAVRPEGCRTQAQPRRNMGTSEKVRVCPLPSLATPVTKTPPLQPMQPEMVFAEKSAISLASVSNSPIPAPAAEL